MTRARLPIEVVRLADMGRSSRDQVAVEDPLTVRVRGRNDAPQTLAVTMRTPGDDLALAIGMCFAEGVLPRAELLLDAQRCPDISPDAAGDVVLVTVDVPTIELGHLDRHGVMTSGCGLCGQTAVADVAARSRVAEGGGPAMAVDVLQGLPARLRASQDVFGHTGGLHAVATFAMTGELRDLREDIGRHNAFDKVVGRAVRSGAVPMDDTIVLLSGRASYELVSKAAVAGVGLVAAIGAPSSMAIDLAQRCGMTLVGFLRPDAGNIYAHPWRVAAGAGVPS